MSKNIREWLNQPMQHTKTLMATIKKHGSPIIAYAGDILTGVDFENKYIYINRGALIVYGRDKFVIDNLDSNSIFLGSNTSELTPTMVKVLADSFFYVCDKNHLIDVGDKNIASALTKWSLWANSYFASRLKVMTSPNAYCKVRFHIEWLSSLSNEYRDNVTTVSFICDGTHISKAHVHSILKQLKLGGYIELNSGHLVKICKELPIKY